MPRQRSAARGRRRPSLPSARLDGAARRRLPATRNGGGGRRGSGPSAGGDTTQSGIKLSFHPQGLSRVGEGRQGAKQAGGVSGDVMNCTRLLFSPTFGTEIFENEFAFARPKGTATAQASQFAVVLGRRFSAHDLVSRVAGRAFERGGLSHGGAYNQCPPRNTHPANGSRGPAFLEIEQAPRRGRPGGSLRAGATSTQFQETITEARINEAGRATVPPNANAPASTFRLAGARTIYDAKPTRSAFR